MLFLLFIQRARESASQMAPPMRKPPDRRETGSTDMEDFAL
jgi:hypothetical protein